MYFSQQHTWEPVFVRNFGKFAIEAQNRRQGGAAVVRFPNPLSKTRRGPCLGSRLLGSVEGGIFLSGRNWIKQLVQKPPLPLMIIIMSGWDWIAVVKDSLRGILENQLEAVWVKVGDGSSWNTYKTCFFSASLITNINQRNEWCTTMNESKEWKFYFL